MTEYFPSPNFLSDRNNIVTRAGFFDLLLSPTSQRLICSRSPFHFLLTRRSQKAFIIKSTVSPKCANRFDAIDANLFGIIRFVRLNASSGDTKGFGLQCQIELLIVTHEGQTCFARQLARPDRLDGFGLV